MSKESSKNDNSGNNYYGGYYYGEGYGGMGGQGGEGGQPHRSIREYISILRERIWWLFIAIFVVVVAVAMYSFNATPLYKSASTVQVLRQSNRMVQFDEVVDSTVRNTEDFNTEVRILESATVADRVTKRLKDADMRKFMAPYEGEKVGLSGTQITPIQVLMDNRKVVPLRLTLMVQIEYTHPDPNVAALIANLFAEEYINYKLSQRFEGSMRAVDELKQRAELQRSKVEELEIQLTDFKEKHKSVSFDAHTDTDQQELLQLNEILTLDKQILDEAENNWTMVKRARDEGRDLWTLPIIAADPQVPLLLQRRTELRIEVAALAQKYRDKHPIMVQSREALIETEAELQRAVANASSSVENLYHRAKGNYENSYARIESKKQQITDLDRVRVTYRSLQDNVNVTRGIYEHLYSRMQQAMTLSSDDAQTANIVDKAGPPVNPFSPNHVLNLFIAVVIGSGLGLGLIFILAVLDDKVKTAFDIESTIGLPLIGIVPRILRFDAAGKARVVASQQDRHTVEAFRSIHSTLKLNEESRNAKVILTTSTIPSEGKSFVSTNLALTFANHGERTIIVDGDLRMPNVAKSLQLENKKGLLQFMEDNVALDDLIQRDIERNFDVLCTGGSTRNPTQVLCSERFEQLMHELRLRYDKIIIDSPPLAPVSDALNILPLVDGVVYVIRFNMVKRKTANVNVRRLRESSVPVFGAILNNINSNVAGYYYSHYYDKSYRKYYVGGARNSKETPAPEPVKQA